MQKHWTVLNKGGKVLLTLKQGTIKADKGGDIQVGFSSIFWNTAWTGTAAGYFRYFMKIRITRLLKNFQHNTIATFNGRMQ